MSGHEKQIRLPRRSGRRGAIVVEMLLVVVVLIIATVGIVQFGVFFANAQQVAFAARVGALEASQTSPLSTTNGNPVPANVVSVIEHQLESSCIEWCHIRLEHNVNPPMNTAVVLESEALGTDCECFEHDPLAGPPYSGTRYVRVTVCVPLSEVMPQQLSFFGTQIYGPEKTYEHTAVYRYEVGTP